MKLKKILTFPLAILFQCACVTLAISSSSAIAAEPEKLRDAWLKFETCREAAESKSQDAQLERCLSAALPRSATLMEKQKAAQFLGLGLKPKEIFECPSSLVEARGNKAEKETRQNRLQYGCFEIRLSGQKAGPSIKGEIEFATDTEDSYRVRKVRYSF